MNRLPLLLLGVSLMVTGCGQSTTTGTAKPGMVLTPMASSDSPAGQPSTGAPHQSKPPLVPAQAEDPLAAAAQKLEPLQVRVELVKSEPAGEKNETALYEWVILARVSAAEVKLPPGMVISGDRSKEPGWSVVRLRLQFTFDKSADDFTYQRGALIAKPGVRQLQMHVDYQSAADRPGIGKGSSSMGRPAKPGAMLMTLTLTTHGSPMLQVPDASDLAVGGEETLEVARGPLDGLVQPVCKDPTTFEAPHELELLRINGKALNLKVVR
jgi:hypothetical protein